MSGQETTLKVGSNRFKMAKIHPNCVSWNITLPPSEAKIWDKDKSYHLTEETINKRYRIQEGDRIVLTYRKGLPFLTASLHGETFRDILWCIYSGLQSNISEEDYEKALMSIESFLRQEDRRDLKQKLEKGTLKYVELVGQYVFYEGDLRRQKDGIWTYGIGS